MTATILRLEDHHGGWMSASAACCVCANEWVAVIPAAHAGPLECPGCGQIAGQIAIGGWVDGDGNLMPMLQPPGCWRQP